jgi:Secretion system C-terminal sorting domain
MKRIIYIFTAITLLFLYLGNAGGPVNVQQIGYTGSPVDQSTTCSSCHFGGNYGASASLEVFDAAGTAAVSAYELGKQYTIRLTITVSTGNPTGYGFQIIDLRQSNNVNVKGFLPTAQQTAGIAVNTITSTGNIYAEHSSRQTAKVFNVKWKAPSTNLGVIVFYGAANAVNGNSDISGDSPTAGTSVQLSPMTTGINELAERINIQLSPNPTPSQVLVSLDSKMSKGLQIRITDLGGRIVLSENWSVTVGQNQRLLDIHTFAKGLYMVQIVDSQNIVSKKILKL